MAFYGTWKPVDEDRYWEMLEILPPAAQAGYGFLVGEPWRHRTCRVSGEVVMPAFAAFAKTDGRHFECLEPLTIAEFRTLDTRALLGVLQ